MRDDLHNEIEVQGLICYTSTFAVSSPISGIEALSSVDIEHMGKTSCRTFVATSSVVSSVCVTSVLVDD